MLSRDRYGVRLARFASRHLEPPLLRYQLPALRRWRFSLLRILVKLLALSAYNYLSPTNRWTWCGSHRRAWPLPSRVNLSDACPLARGKRLVPHLTHCLQRHGR